MQSTISTSNTIISNPTCLFIGEIDIQWLRQLLESIPQIILQMSLLPLGASFLVRLFFHSLIVELTIPSALQTNTQMY
jgi:hypothetical protein